MRIEKTGNDYNLFFKGKGVKFVKEGNSPMKLNLLEGELDNGIFLWSTNLEGEGVSGQKVVVSKGGNLPQDYYFHFDTEKTLRIGLGDSIIKYVKTHKKISLPLFDNSTLNIYYNSNLKL